MKRVRVLISVIILGITSLTISGRAVAQTPEMGPQETQTYAVTMPGEKLISSYEGSITISEAGEFALPEVASTFREEPAQKFFGGESARHGRIIFNVRGASTGLTFAVQITDLYWVYDGWTGCYTNIWHSDSCGTSNGWINLSCANTTSGGGFSPPSTVTTGDYSKGSYGFSITATGNVTSGIRLTLVGPQSSISGQSLPESLLVNYQVLNWEI